MKAVFLDYATMGPGLDLAPLQRHFSTLELFDVTGPTDIAARIDGVEFVFANKTRLSGELLRAASALRFIGLTATGTDNVDIATAGKQGIAVANIRDYCTQSVVEHVIGSLLMLTHNLARYDRSVRAGDWARAANFCMLHHPIRELADMTIGIIGYGALGQGVAKAAAALGMQVLVAARPGTENPATNRVAFDELLRRCDVISLHCPLTEATRGLFNADTIARMRPGAILVNTARGALVESQALVAALRSGHLSGAAIDVLPNEPPVAGDPLLDCSDDNLVLTPHIAWGTGRARQNAINELAANAAAFLQGEHRNRIV
ncbi:MAG: D-2-hydroxyacid dehydrogenase [Gammaproteobacteria bacterium]|nr:D-2-hydroxyacid dehydrogenase [Gammaproteobacteria bacterium]MDH5304333.1 D-2-hydroxyacid dehydrogenase [Gammaproteobacteria bacterium]MDH5321404.1 D-2-hydroxyacid dehydrogenase [Gammaproteobacteria bacterium]